jgi:hypothetical protein
VSAVAFEVNEARSTAHIAEVALYRAPDLQ